jgi:hypothetical protein
MDNLRLRLENLLRSGQDSFESLATKLFAYQFSSNAPYQRYCRSQGVVPRDDLSWQEIPAVPIQAFKSTELCTFPVAQASAIFESSGTSGTVRSRHFFKDLRFYETSLKQSFERWMLPDRARLPFLILTPAPGDAPRSSLSWMFDVVKRAWGASGSQYFVRNGRLDELWLATYLAKSEAMGQPVVFLGTTLAHLAFFEFSRKCGRRFSLPAGSRLLDTGGMKSEKRGMTRDQFVDAARQVLGIPEEWCVNEYGMCEMSSQFYGKGREPVLGGPPWVRTLVMDPTTGREARRGESGLLRHFDLANVDSVMAIQTEDVGRADGDGFCLLGRAARAEVKGCSISAEAFLA